MMLDQTIIKITVSITFISLFIFLLFTMIPKEDQTDGMKTFGGAAVLIFLTSLLALILESIWL